MEPSNAGRKIFRARKTMNPSCRQQIESLNRLKDIMEKERTSKERAKESQHIDLKASDEIICKSNNFTQEGSKFESNDDSLSEEKNMSPSRLQDSTEVLGDNSAITLCSSEKEACHSRHPEDGSQETPKVKPYDIEFSISEQPIENPLIRNMLHEMNEEDTCAVLPEDITVAMTSKLQESLPRKLQDMLVQEKKLIATTASSTLETKRDFEGVKITDKVPSILEKIVIPLNLSEGDEDEGLLKILERINATVDSNVVKETDGAVDILQDSNHVPRRESLSDSSSVHQLNKVEAVSNANRNACSSSESQNSECLGASTTSLQKDILVGDLKSTPFDGSDSKNLSCLGEQATSERDTIGDMEIEDSGESESKDLSCISGKTSRDTVVGDSNSDTFCSPFNESVSCLGATVTPQSVILSVENRNGSVSRKRQNSEHDISTCKRLKPTEEMSSLSVETKEISEKVKSLIERQLQVFFTDVFDQRLEQLTERVKLIKCGKQHEELIAKYIRKLRRFEGHANIVLKSLKEVFRLHNMRSSRTDSKDTVPVENLDLTCNQKILTDQLVAVAPVLASPAVKSSFAAHLQLTSPTKSPTTEPVSTTEKHFRPMNLQSSSPTDFSTPVSASTTAKPSGLVNLQSVSPTVSQTDMPLLKTERRKGTVVLCDSDSESESLPGQAQSKSLTSNVSDVENNPAPTNVGNVLNSESENKVANEDLNKQSGLVIDLTEDEECSSNKAMSIKEEDSVKTNEKPNLKENEALRMKHLSSLKSVNDGEITAFPKKKKISEVEKSTQKFNLEHVNSSETNAVPLNTVSSHDLSPQKANQDFLRVSENAMNPKHGKSNNGDERQKSKLESMEVDQTSTVPVTANSKSADKTSQKLDPDTMTVGESSTKPINTISNEARKAPQISTLGSLGVNDSFGPIRSCLKAQDKEATTQQKSSPAFQERLQPSQLQHPELRVGVKDSLPPQKPELKLTQVQNPRGIALSWNCAKIDPKCSPAQSYCLYVQQEDSSCSKAEWKWKKIGEIKALPLPMACTLSQFVGGSRYYFTVRAKDIFERYGPFADVQSTTLLPMEKKHDSTLQKPRDCT